MNTYKVTIHQYFNGRTKETTREVDAMDISDISNIVDGHPQWWDETNSWDLVKIVLYKKNIEFCGTATSNEPNCG
jgi:hypothetical protein